MTPTSSLEKGDKAILIAIVAVLVLSVIVHMIGHDVFALQYAREDGLVEYGTALYLFVCSCVLIGNAGRLWQRPLRKAALLTVFYALLFFLGAGEEISWGQRIFGWESGEFFVENNKQGETNLHNMVVGELHLAKTLFGSVLTTVILLYLVVLPLLYPRSAVIKRWIDRFAVPVPGARHAILAVAASLVIAVMDQSRKWEVYELIFSLLMLSIFLYPQNAAKTR